MTSQETQNKIETDEQYPSCDTCGSSMEWESCYNCEEGYSYHDCGEDSCNCVNPENNVECDICKGEEGWYRCLGKHEK